MVGELATQHLVDIGRTRIAYISGPDFSPAHDREQAYRAVLSRSGIKVPEHYVVHLPQSEETSHVMGAEGMRKLLRRKQRPDAVFCYNDPVAMGVMMATLEAGLRIPEDVALVGCGNAFHDSFLKIPLTSIDQNAARLGQEAAGLALRAIRDMKEKVSSTPVSVLLKPSLVIRESTVKNKVALRPTHQLRLGSRCAGG